MILTPRIQKHCLVLLGPLLLSGCLGLDPKPDPSRYFDLGGGTTRPERVEADCTRQVLVGPVTLAGHLDDTKIARRVGENEIRYADWEFWAEPLVRALPRELGRSLERVMPDTCVSDYRMASPSEASVQLELVISRFEMTDDAEVLVDAGWRVFRSGESEGRQTTIRFSKAIDGDSSDVSAGVQAMNLALDDLAAAIAKDLK
jgi:uncharacterized lipoprotein YmbA